MGCAATRSGNKRIRHRTFARFSSPLLGLGQRIRRAPLEPLPAHSRAVDFGRRPPLERGHQSSTSAPGPPTSRPTWRSLVHQRRCDVGIRRRPLLDPVDMAKTFGAGGVGTISGGSSGYIALGSAAASRAWVSSDGQAWTQDALPANASVSPTPSRTRATSSSGVDCWGGRNHRPGSRPDATDAHDLLVVCGTGDGFLGARYPSSASRAAADILDVTAVVAPGNDRPTSRRPRCPPSYEYRARAGLRCRGGHHDCQSTLEHLRSEAPRRRRLRPRHGRSRCRMDRPGILASSR